MMITQKILKNNIIVNDIRLKLILKYMLKVNILKYIGTKVSNSRIFIYPPY